MRLFLFGLLELGFTQILQTDPDFALNKNEKPPP